MKKEIWSRSIREEIIAALWLIAGLLAWQAGNKWLAWLLFIKSVLDFLTAVFFAYTEGVKEILDRRDPPNDDKSSATASADVERKGDS